MAAPPKQRLPLQPLLDWCALHPMWVEGTRRKPDTMYPHRQAPTAWEEMTPITMIATLANVTKRSVNRYVAEGAIPIDHAEDFCDAAGIHPTAIYGHAYYEGVEPCSLPA